MVNVEAKVIRTQKKFNFDSKKFITEAMGIIRSDIQDGIDKQRGIDGAALKSISSDWKETKSKPHIIKYPKELAIRASKTLNTVQVKSIKKGASSFKGAKGEKALNRQQARYISQRPDDSLLDGGNLWRNQSITVSENEGEMRIGKQRAEIGAILQARGFNFFGISKIAEEQIHTLLAKRWKQSFEITRAK